MVIDSSHPQIELRRLHRWFDDTHAVNDISFTVHAGEVFGYIGPNGAGKTTSMRILSTLDVPSAGDAYVDGFSVIDDPERVRRRLGFMPDYFGTYPNVNVWEYLDFFARAYGLRGSERKQAVDYAMDFTQLQGIARKPISGLSKGMKQRLCLGRTMVHDPSVMVLDEPAAGLDPRARIELRAMVSRLADAGKAVLISSHILTELAEVCHRVGIIEQGRLLAVGSVAEISAQAHARQSNQSNNSSTASGETATSGVATPQPICSILRVRVLERESELVAWLESRDEVSQVILDGKLVTFEMCGDHESEARLLHDLIHAKFRVVEFGAKQKTLEDVFLHVTEGLVQ